MLEHVANRRLAVLLLVITAPAIGLAQQEADDDSNEATAEEALELAAQVVTGSRLRGGVSASPVFVLTREEIDRRGLQDIEDIIRYIPQNYSTMTAGGSFDYRSPRFAQGLVTINLRGLGEGSTLVLVNGNRIAASPAEDGTFTDVSTIPFSAIERVEVLTDGASAVYGSDAVGGVVNFILRRDYRGAESTVRYENSSSGGHRKVVEQTLGLTWDTGSLTASANFWEEDAVLAADAGIDIDGDYREQGGRRFPATYGQPALLLRFGPFPPNAPPGTRVGVLPPGDGTNINIDDIVYVSNQEWETQSGNFERVPTSPALLGPDQATPYGDHLATYLNFTQQLTDNLSIDFSGMYSEQDDSQSSHGQSFRGNVPPSNYYNNFGQTVHAAYSLAREISEGKLLPFVRYTKSDRHDLSARINWDLPVRDWQARLGYSTGEQSLYNTYFNTFNTDRRSPEGLKFLEALASPDQATAFNPFGDGSAQLDNLMQFQGDDDRGNRTQSQDVISLNADGALFELPAGELRFALGGEMRTDTLDFEDFGLNPFTFRFPDAPDIVPESDNTAWFAEFSIPIAQGRPGIHQLNLNLNGRYDKYEIDGPFDGPQNPNRTRTFSDFVPKIGLVWYPVEYLKIRGTWGEAFQAPTLQSLFSPPSFLNPPHTPPFFRIFDPLNPDGPFIPVFPVIALGGNPNLNSQVSDNISFGFEVSPPNVPGLYLSANYNRTDFTDKIGSIWDALGFPGTFAIENVNLFPGLVERNAGGVLVLLSNQDGNLSGSLNESVDVEVRMNFSTNYGEFVAGMQATRTLTLEETAAPGLEPLARQGTNRGPPELRANVYLDWDWRNWQASVTVRHSSDYENTDEQAVRRDVSSYTTVDVQGTYHLYDAGWRFTLGVENIFDKDFPFFDSFQGVDSSRVDFRRRVFVFDVVKEFDL